MALLRTFLHFKKIKLKKFRCCMWFWLFFKGKIWILKKFSYRFMWGDSYDVKIGTTISNRPWKVSKMSRHSIEGNRSFWILIFEVLMRENQGEYAENFPLKLQNQNVLIFFPSKNRLPCKPPSFKNHQKICEAMKFNMKTIFHIKNHIFFGIFPYDGMYSHFFIIILENFFLLLNFFLF